MSGTGWWVGRWYRLEVGGWYRVGVGGCYRVGVGGCYRVVSVDMQPFMVALVTLGDTRLLVSDPSM